MFYANKFKVGLRDLGCLKQDISFFKWIWSYPYDRFRMSINSPEL